MCARFCKWIQIVLMIVDLLRYDNLWLAYTYVVLPAADYITCGFLPIHWRLNCDLPVQYLPRLILVRLDFEKPFGYLTDPSRGKVICPCKQIILTRCHES